MEFIKSDLSSSSENIRKRKVTFSEVREEKLIKYNPRFTSFKNVFLMGNYTPFFESSRTLPIIRNISENNNNPTCKYYKRAVQYMLSNSILYEKYSMDDEIVFSITMGKEELIIPRVRKSKDKVRNVYVNEIKRIESKYNKDGIEYELNCFNETGKKIVFSRKIETFYNVTSFVSYKYDLDGNIIKKWIE
jgi:hypothetical protein